MKSKKKSGKRAELETYLGQARPERITEAVWSGLLERFAPISRSYLRRLLRACGVPLTPLIEGVRQDSFENLDRTLAALDREYAAAVAAGDAGRTRSCRDLVIEAKDHARLALRSARIEPGERAAKEEMILWMLTWLENPGVFSTWLELRKRARQ